MSTSSSRRWPRALAVALAGTWAVTLAIGNESVGIEVLEALPLVALGICLGAAQHEQLARIVHPVDPTRRHRNHILVIVAVAMIALGAIAGSLG